MKLGLDYHDVITAAPEFWKNITIALSQVMDEHEVHIITGKQITVRFKEELAQLRIQYTHLFSITDYCIEQGHKVVWMNDDNPIVDANVWDRVKGDYARRVEIDYMVDNSNIYHKHFTTPYLLFQRKV